MMKTLLLMRHAKSSWKNSYLADHDRPLNKRGKRDAPRMAQLLREQELVPDLIISSSAKRALRTAEAVVEFGGYEEELQVTRQLYHAWTDSFLELLQAVPETYQRVMLVGHNPGMEELVEVLTGQQERMPTAAVAQIRLPIQQWSRISEESQGELIDIWRPKEISYR